MTETPEAVLQRASGFLDQNGFFRAEDVGPVRAAVAALLDGNTAPDHPAQVFGPWNRLPEPSQRALRGLAEEDISAAMSLRPRGRLLPWLARLLFSLCLTLHARGRFLRLAGWAEMWTLRATTALPKLRDRVRRKVDRIAWKRGRRVSASHVLAALGRSPRWLLGDYATLVRVDPRARGFYHDRGRNVVWGYSIGFDLIPAPDGVWCVEANLNTGAYEEIAKGRWDREAAMERVFQAAREWGFGTVWWEHKDWDPLSAWQMATLADKARSAGLGLVLREDFRVPPASNLPQGMSPPPKRLTSPTEVPENTLVVRRNEFGVGPDWVLGDKEPFIRGIDSALRELGDQRCRVPVMTRLPPDLPPLSDDGLPNLVYKYAGLWGGHGVYFMRVRDKDQALAIARQLDNEVGNNPPGLFQPFVCSRLLPGRRVWDVRCEMLVTPVGMRPILFLRREANQSVPTTLEEGLVSSVGVFTSNLSTGGTCTPLDPAEQKQIEPAALALGEAFARLFSRGFQTVE
ncbi:hypothetical protein ACFL3S_01215 [Gemmatimonadota bacterium]